MAQKDQPQPISEDPEMVFILDDRVMGIWHVNPDPSKLNYMAFLRRRQSAGQYDLIYRFRYYKDAKVFDSNDTFRWFASHGQFASDEAAIEMCQVHWRMVCQHALDNSASWELIRGTITLAEFQEKLITMPAMNCPPRSEWQPGMPYGVR